MSLKRSEAVMGTVVSIEIVRPDRNTDDALRRAYGWFHEIERRCTRFDPDSELMRLCEEPGVAVQASPIVFEAIRFALIIAQETGGAFDPTVGQLMESRGFNRNHRTGAVVRSPRAADRGAASSPGKSPTRGVSPPAGANASQWREAAQGVSYRDVELDEDAKTVRLLRPLTLDLGAIAKGLAVDTAARELAAYENFAIDAGGDLYLAGCNERGEPWSVGIRHPRQVDRIMATLRASGEAVCTSGDYERQVLEPLAAGQPAVHGVNDSQGIAAGEGETRVSGKPATAGQPAVHGVNDSQGIAAGEGETRVSGKPPTAGQAAAHGVTDSQGIAAGESETRVSGEHHILDPRTGRSPAGVASVTVIAPGAMLADALATAAFVLGPEEGIGLLDRAGVEGLIVSADLKRRQTRGLRYAA